MKITPIRSSIEPRVVSAPRVPMGVGTGFAEGLGELSNALGQTGAMFAEIEQRKKTFNDSVSLTRLANEAKLEVNSLLNKVEVSNYDSIKDVRKEGLTRIQDIFSGKASAINPEVSEGWSKAWDTMKTGAILDINKIETEKFRQNTISGVLEFINLMEGEAIKARFDNDTDKAKLIDDAVENAVNNVMTNFNVPATTATAWKEGFKSRIEAKMQAAIDKARKQEDQRIITNAYMNVLHDSQNPVTGEPDYKKAYQLLRSPENLERYGITAEQKKQLSLIIQDDEAKWKEEQDAMKEEQRGYIQKGVMDGNISYQEIDESALDEAEKFRWKTTLESRNKAINEGKDNPMKQYDPAKKAELTRLVLTDPDQIKEKGGIDYIYSHVGKGLDGGLTPEQAEKISKDFKNAGKPEKGPLAQQTYKEALGSLELFRKNLFFIDAEPGDDISNQEQANNDYTYGKIVEELEERVNKGENPYEALQSIMKPYVEKKTPGMLRRFFDFVTFGAFKEEEQKGEEKTEDPKRQQAINILKQNNKVINEETIKKVMDQL